MFDNKEIDALANFNSLKEKILAITSDKKFNKNDYRSESIRLFRITLDKARKKSENQLLKHGSGIRTARSLSNFQDELIKIIYEFAINHIYMSKNPTDSEKVSLVAVGGYGRGTLAPFSDIDLLFLHPNKLTSWAESVIEFVLYMLWDLGFKVGHATRNVNQCLRLSKDDFTIRTSILEARFIHGDRLLYENLIERFNSEIVTKTADEFIKMKLEERDSRHLTYGYSRYLVEPNIKESKGGLRDLHTLFWIGKYLFRPTNDQKLGNENIFLTDSELRRFQKAEDFLWVIRCHLHFSSQRDNEILTFDNQLQIAKKLGYSKRPGLRDVERFMQHYFMTAKEVGNLTRIVCSSLEDSAIKEEPKLFRVIDGILNIKNKKVRSKNFFIKKGRLYISRHRKFEDEPTDILELFIIAEKENVLLSPDIVQQITRSLRLIDKDLRQNKYANKLFVDLFSKSKNTELILRNMNDAGVLGKFIPEFGKIVGMSLFNLYHIYTVDEHLLKSTGFMNKIINGQLDQPHPFKEIITKNLKNKKILLISAFLHDIGKGRKQDHSIVGAQISDKICRRLGLDEREIKQVNWLIRNHLLMSDVAQKRDLYDPKTISDFAKVVKNKNNLDYLLALTVADILAVGPGIWNAWKNGLLITLYEQTCIYFDGNKTHRQIEISTLQETKDILRSELNDWPKQILKSYIDRFNDSYWLTTNLKMQIEHSKILKNKDSNNISLEIFSNKNNNSNTTEITLIGPDHPNLLSTLAGCCLLFDADIVDAQIETTIDGIAIDTISVKREFSDADENRRILQISDSIKSSLNGSLSLNKKILQKKLGVHYEQAFQVKNKVHITNEFSDSSTVVEVEGRDKPGLLYQITNALQSANINIKSAHIATYGERANDVFYITNLFGEKINSDEKIQRIKNLLFDMMEKNN